MDCRLFRRKYSLGCLGTLGGGGGGGVLKATVGNRVQPDYHFVHAVFCFSCFFQPEPCVPWQAMLKSKSSI